MQVQRWQLVRLTEMRRPDAGRAAPSNREPGTTTGDRRKISARDSGFFGRQSWQVCLGVRTPPTKTASSSSSVIVDGLPNPDFLLEIECEAVLE